MPKTVVSVGSSCQTAHQLARFAKENPDKANFQKGPFDWLICPPEHAVEWLNSGLSDFELDEFEMRRERAFWNRHDIWFWHGFSSKAEGEAIIDIERHFDRERAKLDYQRQQFSQLDPAQTVFVTCNAQNNLSTEVFHPHEMDKVEMNAQRKHALQEALGGFFNAPAELVVVSRMDRLHTELHSRPDVHFQFHDASHWKGHDESWDRILHDVVEGKPGKAVDTDPD